MWREDGLGVGGGKGIGGGGGGLWTGVVADKNA